MRLELKIDVNNILECCDKYFKIYIYTINDYRYSGFYSFENFETGFYEKGYMDSKKGEVGKWYFSPITKKNKYNNLYYL